MQLFGNLQTIEKFHGAAQCWRTPDEPPYFLEFHHGQSFGHLDLLSESGPFQRDSAYVETVFSNEQVVNSYTMSETDSMLGFSNTVSVARWQQGSQWTTHIKQGPRTLRILLQNVCCRRTLKQILIFILPSPLQRQYTPATSVDTTLPPPTQQQNIGKKKLCSTNLAHLDGLRGLACFLVVNQHYTYTFTTAIYRGYGAPDPAYPTAPSPNAYITQLPIINLLWNGHASVCIFFVISGLVLSYKPLLLLRQRHTTAPQATRAVSSSSVLPPHRTTSLPPTTTHAPTPSPLSHQTSASILTAISSTTFRRLPRLVLPVLAATLLTAFLSHYGIFDPCRASLGQYPNLIVSNEPCPDRFPLLSQQVSQWYDFAWRQSRDEHIPNILDLHTWTIPVEVRCSFLLFVVLVGVVRLKFGWRLLALVGLCWWEVQWGGEGEVLFLAGMAVGDALIWTETRETAVDQENALREEEQEGQILMTGGLEDIALHEDPEKPSLTPLSPSLSTSLHWARHPFRKIRLRFLQPILLALSLFLLSTPFSNPPSTPGYRTLSTITILNPPTYPAERPLYKSLGAVLLVWVACRWPPLRNFLGKNDFMQYLGKISFALYLMHGPVIRMVGFGVVPWVYKEVLGVNIDGVNGAVDGLGGGGAVGGKEIPGAREVVEAWVVVLVLVGPVIWWASDLFHRVVDEPCVRLARWVEGRCLA